MAPRDLDARQASVFLLLAQAWMNGHSCGAEEEVVFLEANPILKVFNQQHSSSSGFLMVWLPKP